MFLIPFLFKLIFQVYWVDIKHWISCATCWFDTLIYGKMIITIVLVHTLSHNCHFIFVWEYLKTYSPSNTQVYTRFSSVQLLSRVQLFATPWISARQASLSITISKSSPNSRPSSQWCHPAISSSVVPFSCPNPSQHQSLFQWVNSSHEVANVLEFQL